MELQSQHGTSGSLVVIQQPSSDSRQRLEYDREAQPATILSLDQIKAIRNRNEYTEGPSMVRKHGPKTAPRYSKQERTHEIIPVNVNNNNEHRPPHLAHTGHVHMARAPVISRSISTGSAASSGSTNSGSSEQELLRQSPSTRHNSGYRTDRVVRTQPKGSALVVDDLKSSLQVDSSQHRFICEQCGKCKCADCTAPRPLPSCLVCNGQFLCSAECVVEYSTCMCLVKGVFYHCSNDDEGDSWADNPCSCTQPQCLPRFGFMGCLAICFPNLICFPLCRKCLKGCQKCYDRVYRPGCRCKNSNTVYCKLDDIPRGQGKPS